MKPRVADDFDSIAARRRELRDRCTCPEDETESGEPARERHQAGCPLFRPEGEAA